MVLMQWYSSYSIGHKEIDHHHQTLFKLFNLLFDYCTHKQGTYTCHMCVGDLISYAEYHFSAEEHLMRVNHYKDMDKHVQEHNYFRERVMQFSQLLDQNEYDICADMLIFLMNWLQHHIVEEDKKLSACVSE